MRSDFILNHGLKIPAWQEHLLPAGHRDHSTPCILFMSGLVRVLHIAIIVNKTTSEQQTKGHGLVTTDSLTKYQLNYMALKILLPPLYC